MRKLGYVIGYAAGLVFAAYCWVRELIGLPVSRQGLCSRLGHKWVLKSKRSGRYTCSRCGRALRFGRKLRAMGR